MLRERGCLKSILDVVSFGYLRHKSQIFDSKGQIHDFLDGLFGVVKKIIA